MTTIELRPRQASILKAVPEDGVVFYAHIALATQQTPGEVEADLRELARRGLVEEVAGTVRLLRLGVQVRRQLRSPGGRPWKGKAGWVLGLVVIVALCAGGIACVVTGEWPRWRDVLLLVACSFLLRLFSIGDQGIHEGTPRLVILPEPQGPATVPNARPLQ